MAKVSAPLVDSHDVASDRIVSVGGGKGGVGKSVLAANLAVAFAQAGADVILVDGDLGAANQHSLFGIERSVPTVQAFFDREVGKLEELLLPTAIPKLRLVAGSFGIPGAANIAHAQKQKLLRHIRALPADVVVVDVGAGVSFNAIDLFCVADVRLAVMTPQLPSVQNAYSFLKGAVIRQIEQLATTDEDKKIVAAQADGQSAKVAALLETLGETEFRARVQRALASFGVSLIGNQIGSRPDGNVLFAVERMVRDFLCITTPVLGLVPHSSRLHESINRRMPLLAHTRRDECARVIRQIADRVLTQPIAARGEDACLVDVEQPLPEAQLPDLGVFSRRHPRYPVRWHGRFADQPVDIEEISLGGALLRLQKPLERGQEGWLELSDLRGRPRLWATVRNVREGNAVGIEFLEENAEAARIIDQVLAIERTRIEPPAPSATTTTSVAAK